MNDNALEKTDVFTSIIGQEISSVKYLEIDYGKPCWDEEDYHSLDYGVEFCMKSGRNFYFLWGNTIIQFDLKCAEGMVLDEFSSESNHIEYDVSNHCKWSELINKKIIEARPIFSWAEINGTRINYLQDAILTLENNSSIIISASEVLDGIAFGMHDNISIFFDTKIAEKYGVGIENVL